MVFSLRPFNLTDTTLACNNIPIPIVDKAKYLGITLNRKLLWKHHIDDLLANTGPTLNILRMLSSIKWGSDPVILSLFYKTFIRAKLDYGSTLYGSAASNLLKNIECFQNKCLRLIMGASSTIYTSLSTRRCNCNSPSTFSQAISY